jgi:hypothetical protein
MACFCVMPECVRVEKIRLVELGGTFLGSCGDNNHTYGFHLPPCRLPPGDYSLRYGRGDEHTAAAGDFGMDWVGSRQWLALFITQLRAGLHPGVVEVIGSLDGRLVNYWARWQGWKTVRYTGQGHDTWTHIGFDRTKTGKDQQIFEGGSVPLSDADIKKVANAVFDRIAAMPIPNTSTDGYNKLRTLPQAVGDLFSGGPNGKMWPQSSDQQITTAVSIVDDKVDQLLPTAAAISAEMTTVKEALAALAALIKPEQIP